MLRLSATIRKEFQILIRDKAGLAILFLMPMVLIVIMALVQDGPFRDYQELKVPMVFANQDSGNLGKIIEVGLSKSRLFEITRSQVEKGEFKAQVDHGKYDIGVWIPENATRNFNLGIEQFVVKAMQNSDSSEKSGSAKSIAPEIEVFFSPDVKRSFKVSILSSLKQFSSGFISQSLLRHFRAEMGLPPVSNPGNIESEFAELLVFKEPEDSGGKKMELNSVQHNVPAWTIFGMFFIVISLSGSLIREREDGSYKRLRTMPGSYSVVMSGKIAAYLAVCLLQCLFMLLVGLFVLPFFGLNQLEIGRNWFSVFAISISTGLAATGFGILVGTIFKTNQQASIFGAVSIVILAALGGIWIPVYVMPESIKILASLSPLSWSLNAYHQIFLLNGDLGIVWPDALKLLLFFVLCMGLANILNRFKNH